ncbi:MAG TPA: hypothetical protein PKE45_18060, partial [Caldilineaceae bacterium]|nr:hypothetical protein [Caldilineaceae bacterium]
ASYAYDTAGRLTSYKDTRYGYAAAPAPPMALTAGRGLWARAPPREHHSGRHRTAGALVLPLLSSRV